VPDQRVFPLRHGLQLTITGRPSLRALGNFLKAATVHFKNQRDIQRVRFYTAGSFQGLNCVISYPGDASGEHLSPAAWTEAVIDASAKVAALERSAPADELTALGRLLHADAGQPERAATPAAPSGDNG
jgi:hypothetical protein